MAIAGTTVAEFITMLKNLSELCAFLLIQVESASCGFHVDRVGVHVSGQRGLQLNQARRVREILVRRSITSPQFGGEIAHLVLQPRDPEGIAILQAGLLNFPANERKQTEYGNQLNDPKRSLK